MAVSGWFFKSFALFLLCLGAVSAASPSSAEKQRITPHLLPADHPIHPILDTIFSQTRASFNLKSMEKAGFAKCRPRAFTKLIFTKHPQAPGYIFKLYLDAQRYYKNKPEHYFWLKRVQGANRVRELIAAYGWENEFKVPYKWIYELPKNHLPPSGYETKYYVLVEEDMNLLSDKENRQVWASNLVSHDLLNKLYVLLKEAGLSDCLKPDNIPFSQDGRIAFIDTQTYGKRVPFKELHHYLSEENSTYWTALVDQIGF